MTGAVAVVGGGGVGVGSGSRGGGGVRRRSRQGVELVHTRGHPRHGRYQIRQQQEQLGEGHVTGGEEGTVTMQGRRRRCCCQAGLPLSLSLTLSF